MKNITLEAKALAACREAVAAAKEVKRLKGLIGDSLSRCHSEFMTNNPDAHPVGWASHLDDAYGFDMVDETEYSDGSRLYLTEDEQQEVLAECQHCLAAHNAIQDRKKAKRRLGSARRQITMIGRAA